METSELQRRQLLRRICTLCHVAGWAMLATAILGVGLFVVEGRGLVARYGFQCLLSESTGIAGNLLKGLLVLAMVQFIRYAVEEAAELTWLLRNGHVILCLYAALVLLTGGIYVWPQLLHGWSAFAPSPQGIVPMFRELGAVAITLMLVLPILAKALCVLGIAVALRAVLPIMSESKTLA